MNPFLRIPTLFALLSGAVALIHLSAAQAEDEIDCRAVVENFRQNVESAPNHVLTLLEDALIANGGHCVPLFVKTAIQTSAADADTVKKIVFVAITNAQAQAPQIAEAAVSASPNHADSVRAAFADAFKDNNPRLKPADPAILPAWAQEIAPVPKPKTVPSPKVAQAPAGAPKTKGHEVPVIAANNHDNPYMKIDKGGDAGWELLHDGVVDEPIDPKTLAAMNHFQGMHGEEAAAIPPPAVEPELPDMKKKRFGFSLPRLPSLPALPALPEADAPIDLFFNGPFAGVPPLSQDS